MADGVLVMAWCLEPRRQLASRISCRDSTKSWRDRKTQSGLPRLQACRWIQRPLGSMRQRSAERPAVEKHVG